MNREGIPPGTLYLSILKTVARNGKMRGYEIADSIQHTSNDVLQVEEGSLYPALQCMLIKGWVIAEWGTTAGNRRAQAARNRDLAVRTRHRRCHPRHSDGLRGKTMNFLANS